jgi:hypothetical protein
MSSVISLLRKIAPDQMPVAFNVAHSFDVDVTLSTGNTIKVFIFFSGNNDLVITGEPGKIRVNRGSLTKTSVEEIDVELQASREVEEAMVKICGSKIPRSHMANFFNSIRSGRRPVANVREHVRAVIATHLANVALLTGRKVQIYPDAISFPEHAEAPQLVRRTRRSGFEIKVYCQ